MPRGNLPHLQLKGSRVAGDVKDYSADESHCQSEWTPAHAEPTTTQSQVESPASPEQGS